MSEGRVLFLDGIGCNPEGFKPHYIRDLGYEVLAPLLPDADFTSAVRIAGDAVRQFGPDVIVGYSRGGAVAMTLDDERSSRVLIAPALHWIPANRTFRGKLVILHSASDDGLPLADVQDFLCRGGLDAACLRVVGEDHSMIDRAALDTLREALAGTAGTGDA